MLLASCMFFDKIHIQVNPEARAVRNRQVTAFQFEFLFCYVVPQWIIGSIILKKGLCRKTTFRKVR